MLRNRWQSAFASLCLTLSLLLGLVLPVLPAQAHGTTPYHALDFGTADARVYVGDNAALDLGQFTVEAWFRRDGDGAAADTGALSAVPLVAKGYDQGENDTTDICYFLD